MSNETQRYKLKPLNGEIEISIQPDMYNKKCRYRYTFGTYTIEECFLIDEYSGESIIEQLIEKVSKRLAINLSLQLIKKLDPYTVDELMKGNK